MVLRYVFIIMFPVFFYLTRGNHNDKNSLEKLKPSLVKDMLNITPKRNMLFDNSHLIHILNLHSSAQCNEIYYWKNCLLLAFQGPTSFDTNRWKSKESTWSVVPRINSDEQQQPNFAGIDGRDNFRASTEVLKFPALPKTQRITEIQSGNNDIKRGVSVPLIGCDCKIRTDLMDLGQMHYPRYLLNAICSSDEDEMNDFSPKCWNGARCKPLEYKVRVLTLRGNADRSLNDPMLVLLPDVLRSTWKLKSVTVAAGCFCSH